MSNLETTTPNSIEEATNGLGQFANDVLVPTEINKHEEHLVHALVIDRLHLAEQQRYETHAKVVKYHYETFVALKDSFARGGVQNIIIFHNPSLKPKKIWQTPKQVLVTARQSKKQIDSAKTIQEIEALIEHEDRKTVREYGEKKIEKLQGN